MSEFIIHEAENEENSVSCSPVKICPADTGGHAVAGEENFASASEFVGNDICAAQLINIKNSTEHLNNMPEIGVLDTVTERDKKRDYNNCIVENVMHTEAAVDSTLMSDKTPLLKDESSVTGSCTDLNTEGENEISETSCDCSYLGDRDSDRSSLNNTSITSQTRENLMMPGSIKVPIVGHETVESRSKFTVFKIHVTVEGDDAGWFLFRRYSDFVHLNDLLKALFPNFRLSLPPKRWFRNNFDSDFLEERVLGLQAFVDNITGHRDICNSKPVKDFFCFDDPPGPHDSLEESRAQCECIEETLYLLRKELTEKDTEVQLLKEELDLYKNQVQLLTSRLSELKRRSSFERSGSGKHRSPSVSGHFGGDAILGSGDANKLNAATTPRSPEQTIKKQISATDG